MSMIARARSGYAKQRMATILSHIGVAGDAQNRATASTPPRPATHAHEVLQWPAVILSEAQRREYFEHGCLLLPGFIPPEWVQKLRSVAAEYVEKSRSLSHCGGGLLTDGEPIAKNIILGKDHTAEKPSIIRLSSPVELETTFWEFATGPFADIAQDLLGPDVRLHHSKLNFKMGGTENTKIQWHQDIQFWPHTNYTPLTIGVYLQDVDDEMGPMDVVPLSAYDQLHPLEDAHGNWTGVLSDQVLQSIPLDRAKRMKGPAGSVTVHNARCVHGGQANQTTRNRLLLLNTFAAATAHPLDAGTNPLHNKSKYGMPMVRGTSTNLAVFDPRPCPMAPNFAQGYKPPFFESDDKRDKPLMDG